MKLKAITENKRQGYDINQSSPAAIKRRAKRNTARRRAERAGRVHKGDGKHIHHKRPLSKGGSNAESNTEVSDAKSNWAEGNKVANS